MKIEFKKSGENAYSTLSDLGISALFTSRQSDRAGSQGWTVLGLADRAKRMQPQGQGEPPRRGVSPAHKGTPISMSMRAYLWLNGAPCTRSTRFSQLKAPEKSPALHVSWASLIVQLVKNPPAMQETLVRFLGLEDPLEKE